VVDLAGIDNADAFLPAQGERISDDKKVAELEANSFMFGVVPEVMPKEDDFVHLGEHAMAIEGLFQRLQSGAMAPQSAIEAIGSALQHSQMHLKKAEIGVPSESNVPKRQLIKQANVKFQQYQATFDKLVAAFQKQQQAGQEAVAKQQQEMSADALEQKRKDAETQASIARQDAIAQATIQRGNAVTEQAILDKRARTNADLEHSTAKTQAELHHDTLLTEQELLSKTRKTHQDLAVTDLKTAQELEQKQIDNQPPTV